MSLLQMSISAGVMIAVVMIIRALAINRLPKKTFLALWGIVLIRLLVPFSWASPLSIYSLVNRHGGGQISGAAEVTVFPIAPATNALTTATQTVGLSLWALIWGIGAALCTLYFAIAYVRCRREFKSSQPVENAFVTGWLAEHKCQRPITIRQTYGIWAPLTYGIFRPIILMPAATKWTDTRNLQYILAHEYVHIRRFDGVTKFILTAALCTHWFNPLVWCMYVLANRDIELSCDEKVVRIFGETTKSAYALTLIGMEEKKSGLTPLCNSFSKNAIEERIEAIMKIKKTSIAALVIALCLVGGVATTFATSAAANDEKTGVTYADEFESSSSRPTIKEPTQQELVEQYGAYGITFNTDGKMLFNGELVRYFFDGVELGEGAQSVYYEYLNKNGMVDVFTRRNIINNEDGSIDPFGALVGLEKSSQEEFDQRDFTVPANNAITEVVGNPNVTGETFTERFSKYKEYGVAYEERPGSSGAGNVYYNAQMVKTFIDEKPDGGIFTYSSRDGGEIIVHTIYDDNGKLIGVEKQ